MYRNRDHVDESSVDLGKYIGGTDDDHKEDRAGNPRNLHSEQFNMQINRINMKLQTICSERLGDLTSTSTRQIQKTIQLVETLISQIKKHQEMKNKVVNERRQAQHTISQNQQIIERLSREKKNIQNQKQNISQKLKNLEKTLKETVEKNQLQKQDKDKQIKSLQFREKSFEAEFRKRQNTIKTLQDAIKKFQEKNPFKNSFDIIQKFEYGPNIYDMTSTNGQNQYGRLAKQGKDQVIKQLSEENQYFRECLSNIYKQLNSVLELKKETLKNKKGYDGQYEHYYQLNSFKPERLFLPSPWVHNSVKQLVQNVQKFKEAMKIGDQSQNRFEQKKDNCLHGIKKLITNYKQVVETQDQMLNKVLLKAKQFKANEIDSISNKFSANQDIRSKSLIEQHHQFLAQRAKELEKQRQEMKRTLKRAQESKRQVLKHNQNYEEQIHDLRHSIQVLPAMIEQELAKALH